MWSRVVISLIGTGVLAACALEPVTFLESVHSPASPQAAETPALKPSNTLDPSIAASEMGPSRAVADTGSTQPTSGMDGMKGMDMPGMGGMGHMGGMMMPGMPMGSDASRPASQPASTQMAAYYTCVMHPEIHEDHPGNCPLCGMTLIKKEPGDQKGGEK